MTSLVHRIEQLIKREKTTPERKKKAEASKSSSEILTELFGAFNAAPPKIEDMPLKKSKKSKRRHKKDRKKRSHSSSSSGSSSDTDYSYRRKRRKTKSKKRRSRSKERTRSPRSASPVPVKLDPDIKIDDVHIKAEVKTENKTEPLATIKSEDSTNFMNIDASLIPLPDSPCKEEWDDTKNSENDKNRGKIQIKNLKFSAVFEETVKKAEEEARKKAEKYEEGEYTDSSDSSVCEVPTNSQFPKASDLEGIVKKKDDETNNSKSKTADGSSKSSKNDSSKSHRRSRSKSKRSRSRSTSRRHRHGSRSRRRSGSRSRRRSTSRSRKRSNSRSKKRSSSRSKKRSRSRHRSSSRHRRKSRSRSRHRSRHRSPHRSKRSRSRDRFGVKLAESEKKRLLEVARRNAINMLRSGAVPAGAALPPHTRSHVMAAIQSGGKSVDELTDFCKHLSKKEALGELSSVSSHGEDSENEDTLAFHHPFLVKDKAPIVMNIRGGAPLPIKSSVVPAANKEELRLQFPVSSGSQHREKASEWVPVSPKKDNMQVAKLNSDTKPAKTTPVVNTLITPKEPLALPAPLPAPPAPPPAPVTFVKGFTPGAQLSTVSATPPALPAPGPQAYPPGIEPPKVDIAQLVSQKLSMIRKEQEENEVSNFHGFGWSKQPKSNLGQFTGSTGAHILTPRELASGTQAWAKKDQLVRAAPVAGGMGMHLLQKMGWTPGRGLGKEESGTLQPLLLEVKLDTKGLQAREEGPNKQKARMGRRPAAGGFLNANNKHPVSLLGEYCSKGKFGPPEYTLCFECGPDHKKNFLFRVKVAGVEYQPAVASANKKQAKADAAQLALQKLGILP